MPRVAAAPRLSLELADLTLPEARGASVRLGDAWASGPAVLVHVRHFGCLFCRQHVSRLRDAYDAIRAGGASLTVIGTGGRSRARDFVEARKIPFPVLIDRDRISYRVVQARSGRPIGLLRPAVLAAGALALFEGHRQGKTGPHPFQFGGTHIIQPSGEVLFAWLGDDYMDDAPISAVLAMLQGRPITELARERPRPMGEDSCSLDAEEVTT